MDANGSEGSKRKLPIFVCPLPHITDVYNFSDIYIYSKHIYIYICISMIFQNPVMYAVSCNAI